jgi:hypothetical protein
MKRIMRPVDMIAWFDREGGVHPTRLRVADENKDEYVITVDRARELEQEKFGGNPMRVFDCTGTFRDRSAGSSSKYEVRTCLWYLEKIE